MALLARVGRDVVMSESIVFDEVQDFLLVFLRFFRVSGHVGTGFLMLVVSDIFMQSCLTSSIFSCEVDVIESERVLSM